MTSPKKLAANRLNGRRSRGPRTSAGKARSSRNARRHGLAAFGCKDDPSLVDQVEQMVNAMCADSDDLLLRQQARMIAENQFWLSRVRAEKLALIERLRDPTAFALASKATFARAKARVRLIDIADSQLTRVKALVQKTIAAGGDPKREPVTPELEAAWRPVWAMVMPEDAERDEHEALCESIVDLVRLLRYEQRAWARRKSAVRAFMAIKLTI